MLFRSLPPDVRNRLSQGLKSAIESPDMRALIQSLRYPEYYLGPAEVTQVLEAEAATLSRAIARIKE